jgi:hypothetical protein
MDKLETSHLYVDGEKEFATPVPINRPQEVAAALVEYDDEEMKNGVFQEFLDESEQAVDSLAVEGKVTAFDGVRSFSPDSFSQRDIPNLSKETVPIELGPAKSDKADEYLGELRSSFETYRDAAYSEHQQREKEKDKVIEWCDIDEEMLHGTVIDEVAEKDIEVWNPAEDAQEVWEKTRKRHDNAKNLYKAAKSAAAEAADVIDEVVEGIEQKYSGMESAESEVERYTEAWEQVKSLSDDIELAGSKPGVAEFADAYINEAKDTFKETKTRYEEDVRRLGRMLKNSGCREESEFWNEVKQRSEYSGYLEELVANHQTKE